jgi:hypothetical protein
MEQTMVNIGEYNENWKRWVVAWLMGVAVVALATPLGFLTTLTGTAGLFFLYHGIRAVGRAVSSTSVERATIGSLDGRRETVQILGSAKPVDEPFIAPMTGTDCVAWDVRVKEYKPSDDD